VARHNVQREFVSRIKTPLAVGAQTPVLRTSLLGLCVVGAHQMNLISSAMKLY
jgi:hypothetical protein